MLIGKRRRHTTSEISEPRKSETSSVSDSHPPPKVKRGPGRPPKIKEDANLTEVTSEDEQDIDVCGFDDSETDTDKDGAADNVFSSQHYSQKHKHHSTKRKHKSDNEKDEKVKKKKVNTEDKKKDRNVFDDQGKFLMCNHSDIPHLSFIHHYHFGNHHEGISILAQSRMFSHFTTSAGSDDIGRNNLCFKTLSLNLEPKSRMAPGTNFSICVVLPSSCFIFYFCFKKELHLHCFTYNYANYFAYINKFELVVVL